MKSSNEEINQCTKCRNKPYSICASKSDSKDYKFHCKKCYKQIKKDENKLIYRLKDLDKSLDNLINKPIQSIQKQINKFNKKNSKIINKNSK